MFIHAHAKNRNEVLRMFFFFGSDEQAIELVREKTILLLVDEKEMYAHEGVATRERERKTAEIFFCV